MTLKKIANVLNNAHEKAINFAKPLIDEADTAKDKVLSETKEWVDNPEQSLRKAAQSAKDLTQESYHVIGKMSDQAGRAVRNPKAAWDTLLDTAEDVVVDVSEGVSKVKSDIADGMKGAMVDDNSYAFYDRALYYQGSYIEKLIRTKPAFDTMLIMGESLSQFLTSGVYNPDIINAYELAYPNLSAKISLADKVEELSEEQLVGLINGIKGKLFEVQYVELLNDELLTQGAMAMLSESATEPGWDIKIVDSHGLELELLQAKATSSVYYVQQAMERYPNIDVVTTEETFSQLEQMGVVEGVINSGLSNEDMQRYVEDSMSGSDGVLLNGLPVLSLAIIAFTSYNDLGQFDVSDFTHRGCQAYIAYLVSLGVMTASGVWLFGPIASIGVMGLMHNYSQRYRTVEKIKNQFQLNEHYINRLQPRNHM